MFGHNGYFHLMTANVNPSWLRPAFRYYSSYSVFDSSCTKSVFKLIRMLFIVAGGVLKSLCNGQNSCFIVQVAYKRYAVG